MAKPLRETFADNLKFYRTKQGYTQMELDVQIDKNPNYINGIENRHIVPSPETIEKICEALKIEPAQLFDRSGSPRNAIDAGAGREAFVKDVADELYRRISAELKQLLHREIDEAVRRKMN